jgi:hypothetical protein
MRLSEIKLAILKNAKKKISYFNRIGIHYEAVYHFIIRKREQISELWNDEFIDAITAGLISFDMQRMMGKNKYLAGGDDSWASKLKNALQQHLSTIEGMREYALQSIDLNNTHLITTICEIFDDLSKPGYLSVRR